ncbi:MAG: IS5 family transposase [Verrucomicrobia bacterium]|nr:IS5 family transposase [Verrucomicrobiota bacterium]
MNRQMSFAESEFAGKKRVTRKEALLAVMEKVVAWKRLVERLEPYYPKGSRGRPPVGLERMLRLLVVQNCFGYSDEGLEDAVTEIQSIRHFVGVDLSEGSAPDSTTMVRFRNLLNEHNLARAILEEVNASLAGAGLIMRQGTVVDATIIAAPSSTKNAEGKRDPEMHSTKKGNQWHFGMKAHIGVDASSGLVHSVVATAANEADINCAAELLHGEEKAVFADAGYTGAQKRPEVAAKACGATWHVAAKRGLIKAMAEGALKSATVAYEKAKASVRALVEHPFQIIKQRFGYRKVRYRGLQKNLAKLEILFALANLILAKRRLMPANHI